MAASCSNSWHTHSACAMGTARRSAGTARTPLQTTGKANPVIPNRYKLSLDGPGGKGSQHGPLLICPLGQAGDPVHQGTGQIGELVPASQRCPCRCFTPHQPCLFQMPQRPVQNGGMNAAANGPEQLIVAAGPVGERPEYRYCPLARDHLDDRLCVVEPARHSPQCPFPSASLPNLPFYGTTLPTKGVSSPSVTVLSRAVTHRDTAAMPGWFNRAATGQLAGPRSAAMPSPHGGRAARITFGAVHAANTSQRERPLRSPALQQGRTQPCSPRGSRTARAPCTCPAAVGAAEPDQIQHVSGHQVLRTRVPCNQVAVPPAEREHVAAIEVTAGAGAIISSASRPRPARYPRHGAPDAGRPLIS